MQAEILWGTFSPLKHFDMFYLKKVTRTAVCESPYNEEEKWEEIFLKVS